MIDLHSHILPGVDDGPVDVEGSLALAREVAARGTRMIAATPHIRDDYPFPHGEIQARVAELNRLIRREGIDLEVIPGGEVSISKVPELDDTTLRSVCLADGPYMLVESPYTHVTDLLENVLFDLQARGFKPLLAHPERSPAFGAEPERLAVLVERGILCSITAMSMEGGFGSTVQRFTAGLFEQGLVHNVASDTHSPLRRPPNLLHGFEVLERELPGLAAQATWFTEDAPRAMIAGARTLPEAPSPLSRRRGLRRLFRVSR